MAKFEERSRSELLSEARKLSIERPERMTRVELRDAIVQRTVPESQQAEARGLFGVARSMLASVVETGLNLPDAAKVIRGDNTYEIPAGNQRAVATVTLAEIYAAQGHRGRALRVLDDVLRVEPDHEEALRVKAELKGSEKSEKEGASLASDSVATPSAAEEELSEDELTVKAPPVSETVGETMDYVPGGFVETTGEAIETEQPPEVEAVVEEPKVEAVVEEPKVEAVVEEPKVEEKKEQAPSVPALVVAQSSKELALYWELPQAALEQCGMDASEGQAALKVVAFTASGAAPERSERTVVLTGAMKVSSGDGVDRGAGVLRLMDFGTGATIRAAIGWETDDAFLALSVGRSLEQWGAERKHRDLVKRSDRAFSTAK